MIETVDISKITKSKSGIYTTRKGIIQRYKHTWMNSKYCLFRRWDKHGEL